MRGRLVLLALVLAAAVWIWRANPEPGEVQAGDPIPSEPSAAVELTSRKPIAPPEIPWNLVGVYEHDPSAFTQGLLWHQDRLYESLGNYGKSALRRWDLESGLVEQQVELPKEHFAEGLVLVGDELIQLTWREGVVYRWSLPPFEKLGEWPLEGEGWGLTYDGVSLISSDGSAFLTWHDPKTFSVEKALEIHRAGRPEIGLNEMEWVNGDIYANVWGKDEIVRIDAKSGEVTGVLVIEGLLSDLERSRTDVLNGIAYRPETGTLLVTGKYWPKLFELEIVEAE
ncbi:MAG: glutaminyl-peptide cyclotransferase [Thermoanaerobaculia bacterium]|nr:glutaminyl-peptide cyclotransferase [Thermoanaerobaculia bacterium]